MTHKSSSIPIVAVTEAGVNKVYMEGVNVWFQLPSVFSSITSAA